MAARDRPRIPRWWLPVLAYPPDTPSRRSIQIAFGRSAMEIRISSLMRARGKDGLNL